MTWVVALAKSCKKDESVFPFKNIKALLQLPTSFCAVSSTWQNKQPSLILCLLCWDPPRWKCVATKGPGNEAHPSTLFNCVPSLICYFRPHSRRRLILFKPSTTSFSPRKSPVPAARVGRPYMPQAANVSIHPRSKIFQGKNIHKSTKANTSSP